MMEHFTYSVKQIVPSCELTAPQALDGLAVKQGKLCLNENNVIHKNALNRCDSREMLWLVQKQVITGGK